LQQGVMMLPMKQLFVGSIVAGPAAHKLRLQLQVLSHGTQRPLASFARFLSSSTVASGSDKQLPPVMPAPDTDRKGTADLADVFMPE
jgi:hypothetical protein